MKIQGIVAAVVMAAGGMCPLVRVPILGNWNYFQIDQTLGITFYVLVLIGLIGAFAERAGLVKFSGWAVIGLVILTLTAVYFKTESAFGFLHFKKLVSLAAGLVKFKWGWFVISAGALIAITARKPKAVLVNQNPELSKAAV